MVQVDITVPARTWLDGDPAGSQTPSATCGVPQLYSHGRLNITLTVKNGTGIQEFRGYVSVLWGAQRLNTKYEHFDSKIIFTYATNTILYKKLYL